MIMYHANNSVSNLLWCLLITLRTIEHEYPFTSEALRRKFILNWINTTRNNNNFLDIPFDFTILIELLKKIDKSTCMLDILNTLFEQSDTNKISDLSNFRAAFNILLNKDWQYTICHDHDNIITEIMIRRKGSRRYALQLLGPEKAFNSEGEMVKPITFYLIFSQEDLEHIDAERIFYNEGYQVIHVSKDIELANNRMIRTLHIGLATLLENDWNPLDKNIWKPCKMSLSQMPDDVLFRHR